VRETGKEKDRPVKQHSTRIDEMPEEKNGKQCIGIIALVSCYKNKGVCEEGVRGVVQFKAEKVGSATFFFTISFDKRVTSALGIQNRKRW